MKFLKLLPKSITNNEPTATNSPIYLIVGLGNPGRQYRSTRHNIGFMQIDYLADRLEINLTRVQSKSLIASTVYDDKKIILVKPQTFMNLSGQAVVSLVQFYKIPLDHLLVIHDDLDLPLGTIRIRPEGGSAGQKGLQSIIDRLGTQSFPRLRLGIGRPPGRMDAADYVLEDFLPDEKEILKIVLEKGAEAILRFVSDGLVKTMNIHNGIVL
jgi:PTH1 family peptidyl-tRNA hydrolase